jgi:antitoxin HicB
MENKIDYYMNLPYTIELQHDPEEGWFVRVKELRGCTSQGDTPEEAITMIQEAMALWLEVALEEGVPIPEPRPDEDYSGKFVVRVPRSLHRELVQRAEQEEVSLNQYINVALAYAAGRSLPAAPPMAAQVAPAWPGIKPVVQQALIGAGLTEEAGQLDERLFADWAERVLAEVEGALEESPRKALCNLEQLAEGVRAGVDKSPVMETLYRMLQLLDRQIEAQVRRREAAHLSTLPARIVQFAEDANLRVAEPLIHEERAAYSKMTASEVHSRGRRQREYSW